MMIENKTKHYMSHQLADNEIHYNRTAKTDWLVINCQMNRQLFYDKKVWVIHMKIWILWLKYEYYLVSSNTDWHFFSVDVVATYSGG